MCIEKTQFSQVKVPKGHVWVEGDSAEDSVDSRSFGPIPYSLIQSRVFYRVSMSSCVYKIQWNLRIKDGTVVLCREVVFFLGGIVLVH